MTNWQKINIEDLRLFFKKRKKKFDFKKNYILLHSSSILNILRFFEKKLEIYGKKFSNS